MFIAHYAIPLAGKRLLPDLPLTPALGISIALDLFSFSAGRLHLSIGPVGFSHNIYFTLVLAALAFTVSFVRYRDMAGALYLAALPLSHAALDLVSSRIAWLPGGPHLGLSLYRYPAAEFLIETALLLAALAAYRDVYGRSRRRDLLVVLLGLLLLGAQAMFNFLL